MMGDPLFWGLALLAVFVTGLSKGGFGGVALMAVPLMSISISPVKAAGIMLPILLVMDFVSMYSFRKTVDKTMLALMLPGAICGIVIGGLVAGFVSDRFVLICVGVIALSFSIYSIFKPKGKVSFLKDNKPVGVVASVVAGFTSFVAHAGSPPYQVYVIPQGLEKETYAGTAVVFFFVMNFLKIIPYAMLGQFSTENLTTSLMLMPFAPVGVLFGVWLLRRISQAAFYKFLYAMIFIVGCKVLYDGLLG